MFKKDKDLVERSKVLLKKTEVKSLRNEVLKQLPVPFATETEGTGTDGTPGSESLVLEGKPSIYCSKLANRTIVFTAGTVR
jgi:hypothetical protein